MNTNFLKFERPKPIRFLSVSSAMLIFSLVSVSTLLVMSTICKVNYAFAQTSILRTMELKVNFKKLVEVGSNQNIRVTVRDVGSGDPISSATARMTIYFPGGAPIRQFTLLSDRNGDISLRLPIDRNAAVGEYGIDVLVAALGYFDSALGTVNFTVMSEVDAGHHNHDNHNHDNA